MKSMERIITASILVLLIPFANVAGQEKKSDQRIKIVIAEDNGSKLILDTLITGNSSNDSIVLKNGNIIHLAKEINGDFGGMGTKKYIVTSSSSAGDDVKKEIIKEITIISSDSDFLNETGSNTNHQAKCESLVSAGKYSHGAETDTRGSNSEKTKYIITRDEVVITVEGNDYTRVREIIKDIENTLDTKKQAK
jgi:hypothetical protein